jgi:hypothetical protein
MVSQKGTVARERRAGGALNREEMEDQLDVWSELAGIFNDPANVYKRDPPLTIYDDIQYAQANNLPTIDPDFKYQVSVQGIQTAWGALRTAMGAAMTYARAAVHVRASERLSHAQTMRANELTPRRPSPAAAYARAGGSCR